ncbi:MAG TPA: hypothetical protein VL177_08640, partial [Terriglobales bacterium]|nr:hypothetical protein [Terriglobales bacterium]
SMGVCIKGCSCQTKARARNHRFLFLLGVLVLLASGNAGAQCQGSCVPPSAPATPTAPTVDTDGTFNVTVSNTLGSYGYTVWSSGQTTQVNSDLTSTLSISKVAAGSYSFRAKNCYKQDNTCSGWSPYATVNVLPPPANPTIGFTVATCDSVAINWSPGATGYPAGHEKRYDLWESTDGGVSFHQILDRVNTIATSWTHPNANGGINYRYRVRAFYLLNGYTSGKTPWIQTAVFQCTGGSTNDVTLDYQYDALGRMMRVLQDGSPRIGYCYDEAGNRYDVVENSATCPGEPPAEMLAPPTGLTVSWQTGPSYLIQWNPLEGAVSYQLMLNNGFLATVSGTSYSSNSISGGMPAAPLWVQGCTENGACGVKADF